MPPFGNKKICLICMKLSGGGVPRTTATISQMLENLGHTVHIVTIVDGVDYSYAGTLYNLEENGNYQSAIFRKVFKWRMLKRFLKRQNFDLIIDNRTRIQILKEFTFHRVLYRKTKVLDVVHSGKLKNYLPSNKQIFRLLYRKNYILAVSNAIREKIFYKYGVNPFLIYNAIDIKQNKLLAQIPEQRNYQYILYSGRIDEKVKNISLLISAYQSSLLMEYNIHLVIMGNGDDKQDLIDSVNKKSLSKYVHFVDYDPNPFPYLKYAHFTVLTSRFEGFPMILLESLSVGTPVISVDDISGPSEIIQNEINGLLVENHNPQKLADAFNSFVIDESLYLKCKNNAESSVQRFDIAEITEDWSAVLKEIFNDNNKSR